MQVLRWFESVRTPFFDGFFKFWTLFGEEAMILVLFCVLYWCVDKGIAYRAGMCFFCSGLTVQGMKIAFRIPRPWVIDPSFTYVEGAAATATGYSFPSGHTQASVSLFFNLAFMRKNPFYRIACILIFILVAVSRLYLGVHTPADVSAALAIALAFSAVSWLAVGKNKEINKKREFAAAAAIALFAAAAAVYSYVMYTSGTIAREYVSDCCKAAGAGIGFSIGWYAERVYIRFSTGARKLWMQFVKAALGLGVALLLKAGLKALFPATFAADLIRYMVLVVWCTALYPLLIKRFVPQKRQDAVPAAATEAQGGESAAEAGAQRP